ncbi:hypothetical protein [Acinetobacter pseudolwoffii]|jgi:hypothetical protein|uniref:hypothetical protein n=1 Tax=Acinetobacter pseudolwoffii TaxID=2053287 RepID=UPI00257617C0|nr:hypothetical protein [Acinetobacter pseudolwoffii]MDM1325440.1 hypothetical protein [Acinetobacter pseudolwoffii]
MKNRDIENALNLVGKLIIFDETQDDLKTYSHTGKVLSAIIEHDENHKVCVEISEDNAEVFELNRMHNIQVYRILESTRVLV